MKVKYEWSNFDLHFHPDFVLHKSSLLVGERAGASKMLYNNNAIHC